MIDSLKAHTYWVNLGKATRIDQSHTGSGPCQISLVLSSVSGLPDALRLQDLYMVTSPLLFTYSSTAHTQFKPFSPPPPNHSLMKPFLTLELFIHLVIHYHSTSFLGSFSQLKVNNCESFNTHARQTSKMTCNYPHLMVIISLFSHLPLSVGWT